MHYFFEVILWRILWILWSFSFQPPFLYKFNKDKTKKVRIWKSCLLHRKPHTTFRNNKNTNTFQSYNVLKFFSVTLLHLKDWNPRLVNLEFPEVLYCWGFITGHRLAGKKYCSKMNFNLLSLCNKNWPIKHTLERKRGCFKYGSFPCPTSCICLYSHQCSSSMYSSPSQTK